MLVHLAILFPTFVCLQWTIMMVAFFRRTMHQRVSAALACISAIYFLIDAYQVLSPGEIPPIGLKEIIGQFISLSIFPFIYLYLRTLRNRSEHEGLPMLFFIPAIVNLTLSICGYTYWVLEGRSVLTGTEPIYRFQSIVNDRIYDVFILVEIAFTVVFMMVALHKSHYSIRNIRNFLFNEGETTSYKTLLTILSFILIICGIRVVIGKGNLMEMKVLSSAFSIILGLSSFCLFYISAFCHEGRLTLDRLLNPLEYQFRKYGLNHIPDLLDMPDDERAAKVMALKVVAGEYGADEMLPDDMTESQFFDAYPFITQKMVDSLKDHLMNDKPYLDPEITIDMMADNIGTNRTYISIILNQYYKMPFRMVINKLRLEEAKRLMIQNPEEILDTIAQKSGFRTASQLNRKFKDLEGVTPRIWLQRGPWEKLKQ